MDFETILNGQVYVNMLISPISDHLGILIMLDGEDILRFYLTVETQGIIEVDHEIQAFLFDNRVEALDFAMNITKYTALDLLVLISAKHYDYSQSLTQ